MKRLRDMTEPELKLLCTTCAEGIKSVTHLMDVEGLHFVLLLFNDPGVAQYIGNCERADIITAMRETADRLESNQDVRR